MQPLVLFFVFFLKLVVASTRVEEENSMTHHLRRCLDLREVLVPSTASPKALFQSCVFLSAPFLKKSSAKRKRWTFISEEFTDRLETNNIARKHRKGILP